MLMVATTVRMVHRIHSNTTSTRPVVTLSLVLMVSTTSLEQRLINTTTTSNNSNRGTRASADCLLSTTGKADTCLVVISRVADNGGI